MSASRKTLNCSAIEHGWRVLDDAIQRGDARLMQRRDPGAFGLVLLLLPLELAPPFLGFAFLLLLMLLSEPFGLLLTLGSILFGLRFLVGLVFRIAYWRGCTVGVGADS